MRMLSECGRSQTYCTGRFLQFHRNATDLYLPDAGMVHFDRHLVDDLLESYYEPRGIALRGCHPRDLIEHALTVAEYHGKPRTLTPALLRAACDSYFVDDSDASSLSPSASHA